jgi:hypothetical protein
MDVFSFSEMDVLSFSEMDDATYFKNVAEFQEEEFDSFFAPLEKEEAQPKRKAVDRIETAIVAKRQCAQVSALQLQPLQQFVPLQQLVPFPAMEAPCVDPAARAHATELGVVQRALDAKDKRGSKSIFVSKDFLKKELELSEKKSAEIRQLQAQVKSLEQYWSAQAVRAQPRIQAIASAVKTLADVVQGTQAKTLTPQQAAGALQQRISPLLPAEIVGYMRRSVGALAPKAIKVAYKRTPNGILISIEYPKHQMSSKSSATATSCTAITASTSSAIASSSRSSSWK